MKKAILFVSIGLALAGMVIGLILAITSPNDRIPDSLTIKPSHITLDALRKIDQRIALFGYDDYNGDNKKELVLLYTLDEKNCVFTLYGFQDGVLRLRSKAITAGWRNAYDPNEKPLNAINVDGIPGKEIVIEDGAGSYQAIFFVVVRNDKLIVTEERVFSDLIDCRRYDNRHYLVETIGFQTGMGLMESLKENKVGVSRISYVNRDGDLSDILNLPEGLYPLIYDHYFDKYLTETDIWNFIDVYGLIFHYSTKKPDENWIRQYAELLRKHYDDPSNLDKIIEVLIKRSAMDDKSFREYLDDGKISVDIW